ncbi:uncharacterized protein F4807DRAFT_213892 [Annulohypoxylon truncatum]|uniref:uncharacterized protein n=1 Tax=Annulohypoxylon truncatum TaxID=327061 RepID=UPI0020077820|nr:uncharacterized protein F4807DRAFT_213892 [Annulohypoxylon truncatum]KAI1207096.1 hypothetical protein F4807DRAFT_213892 [Annulohypoxylon truncatum]
MPHNPQNAPPHFAQGPQNGTFEAMAIPEPMTQVRGDPWQSVSALQLGLQPRSFNELHTERMYLLEMLQQHDRRAIDLFMKVPVVEEKIYQARDPQEQKQAKKHRGWLRHRIVDTVEEEKKILARLSELHVEIQCRERWSRVERERERLNITAQHAPAYANPPMPSLTPWGPQTYPLPPELPAPNYPYYVHTGSPGIYYQRPISAGGIYSSHNEDHETPTHGQNPSDNDFGPEAHELDDTAIDHSPGSESRRRSQSLVTFSESRPTHRSSMPSLSRTWSGQSEGNGNN